MKSKVYFLLDGENRIVRCEGGYTMGNIENIDEWALIDEGYGDRYNLCQSNYFPKCLVDGRGIKRYKAYPCVEAPAGEIVARFFKDDVEYVILERTQEEMDADYVEPKPTPSDGERITALEDTMTALIGGIMDAV